jgi:hypothetical protein
VEKGHYHVSIEERSQPVDELGVTLSHLYTVYLDDNVVNYIGTVAPRSHEVDNVVATPRSAPTGASFLLDLFLSKSDRAAIRGDLEEDFSTEILPRYGASRAQRWFWFKTVGIIATRNKVARWVLVGGLARIGEWIFRHIGS